MGAHQRIDRLARRELKHLLRKGQVFPSIREILHFEGLNGPDGIKRKSPGQDEPWHYLDPENISDTKLKEMISDHIHNLTEALSSGNTHRAAFESAWMAHAITDGLTPAHHYPLEEKLEELRGGEGLETRNSPRKKLVMPGSTKREKLRNNWEYWGAKGIMTTHLAFELGIATAIAAGRIQHTAPSKSDIARLKKDGFLPIFEEALDHIVGLQLYEEFTRSGWTRRLARDTRNILIPEIVRVIAIAWYYCSLMAEEKSKS